jgi:hypothetical protein
MGARLTSERLGWFLIGGGLLLVVAGAIYYGF